MHKYVLEKKKIDQFEVIFELPITLPIVFQRRTSKILVLDYENEKSLVITITAVPQ